MNFKRVIILGLLFIQAQAYAEAEKTGGPEGGRYIMTRFDSNHDNQVTKAEFLDSVAERFKQMDVNGDKLVTLDEFLQRFADFQGGPQAAKPEQKPDMHFIENDADKNGAINQAEYVKAAERHAAEMFAKKDKNGDHQLSKEEFTSSHHPNAMADAGKRPAPEKIFAKLDINGDKSVTEQEYIESRNKWFAELDKNNDGIISAAEAE